jgi:hypothetical protein
MPRFAASGRTTNAPTALLPGCSLYATAGVAPQIVEIGMWNTTATACEVGLVRISTAGTQGAAISVLPEDHTEQTAIATPKQSHTSTGPTITAGLLRQASLGAAIGSGVIWTWPENYPLAIAAATTNGIGITCPTGTGQILSFYICWIE